jgi:hypothetical protein
MYFFAGFLGHWYRVFLSLQKTLLYMLTREISEKKTPAKTRRKEWKLLHALTHTLDTTGGLLSAGFGKSHCGERGTEMPGLGLAA